jgi:hypothetical protein
MPNFFFCEGTCTASTTTVSNADLISISPSGTVAMAKGGDTLPTFTSPNVSNVNTSLGTNPLVKVNGN